jgi:hypothetical protein
LKKLKDKELQLVKIIIFLLLLILNFKFVDVMKFIDLSINQPILSSNKIYCNHTYFEYEIKRKNTNNTVTIQTYFSKKGLSEVSKKQEIIEDLKKYKIQFEDVILVNKE